MKLKLIFQTILILTIFIIIIAFYYTFFAEKNKDIENLSRLDDTKKIETEINENSNIKEALKVFNKKNLGVLIAKNNRGNTTGIISDGDFKRINYKTENINNLIIKKVMKKNPIIVNENMLAAEALSVMNNKKITALCVFKKNKRKTTGLIHMHSILNANIK